MADLKIRGITTNKARSGNNVLVEVTGTRDGAIYTMPWAQAMALEGRVFNVSAGSFTTPISGKTAPDADQPELAIDVPTGTTILPVYIEVYLETTVGTAGEIIAQTSTNAVGAGTSTALTPVCTRRGANATACLVYSAYTGNGTAPTGTCEFWRAGHPIAMAAGVPAVYEWTIDKGGQVIVGPGGLQMYLAAGTSITGFLKVQWIELPSDAL
jgi:hypothetical protein